MTRNLMPLALLSILATPLLAAQPVSLSVSGTGVHRFTTAIVHSAEATATGMIQRSTETVDVMGDLNGRLLYHPTSVFDFAAGTLVNTGLQVFSGTVLGSKPLLMFDDDFRFDVNLQTGATTGVVYLRAFLPGDMTRCDLQITGTGLDAAGDATFVYTGECRIWSKQLARREHSLHQ